MICVVVLLAVSTFGTVHSYASKIDLVTVAAHQQKQDPTLVLTRGLAEVVDVPGEIADVMVADPRIADVTAIQSNRLYIVGTNLGSTNIIALDSMGDVVSRLNVHVKIDDGPIQALVSDLYPDEDVQIKALERRVILSGTVSTPDNAQRISNLVASYIGEITGSSGSVDDVITNLLHVKGAQQVMLRVRVVELSRTILREVGADTFIDDFGISDLAAGPGGALFGGLNSGAGRLLPGQGRGGFSAVAEIGSFGPITTTLTALENEGLARILAEPNLTAISGESAGFLAGGEFPVPAGRDNEGNLVIDFRQFGVSLSFRPVVMSAERISLQLDTEVSSLSRTAQVQLAGIDVPGLDVRRATTTVEMGSGGTLMIAGLIQSESLRSMSDVPGIKNVPILSDLMSSDSFRRDETELVVLVSPYLVEPYADSSRVQQVPQQEQSRSLALARAFARNIKRTYKNRRDSLNAILDREERYGYLLD